MTDVVPTSKAEAAEQAFAVQSRIQGHIQALKGAWVDLARDLFLFSEREMWKALGHTSFGAWMADPDVDIEPRYGYILVDNYRQLVVNAGVDEAELRQIDQSKVQVIAPALRRKQVSVEEALADCRSLGRDDLRERYHSKPNGSKPDDPLDAMEEFSWAVCGSCGSKYKVRRVEV